MLWAATLPLHGHVRCLTGGDAWHWDELAAFSLQHVRMQLSHAHPVARCRLLLYHYTGM